MIASRTVDPRRIPDAKAGYDRWPERRIVKTTET
jgi:hypothetical protein